MKDKLFEEIFNKGSKTFYNSSVFFPKDVRNDVYVLYAFVRVTDDFVDSIPQDKNGFLNFRNEFEQHYSSEITSENIIISAFTKLAKQREFDYEWIKAFLDAMEQDLTKKSYSTLEETSSYMYGSAKVVGLMMAKILNLPKESYEAAKLLGKAFQYINFLRDVKEDISLGRRYLPTEELAKFGLKDLNETEAKEKKEKFKEFMSEQINKYIVWQKKAEEGFKFIPKRYLIPIKTASDMYKWTAKVIKRDPFVIFEKKVKPSKIQVVAKAVMNTFTIN